MSPKLFDDRTARADEGDDPTTRTLARGPMYLLIGRKVDAPWIACRASCFQCGIGIDNWTYLTTRRCRILCFELLVPLVSQIVKESRNDFGKKCLLRSCRGAMIRACDLGKASDHVSTDSHRALLDMDYDKTTDTLLTLHETIQKYSVQLDKLLRLFSSIHSILALDWL